MGINPVDQPAVELGKRLAKARLGASGLEAEKAALAAFIGTAGGGRDERGF
jgi:glucose-6-phosphate isomerase